MYWTCGPCQNNRHDLCLQDSASHPRTKEKLRCWCSSQPTHQLRSNQTSLTKMVTSAGAEPAAGRSGTGREMESTDSISRQRRSVISSSLAQPFAIAIASSRQTYIRHQGSCRMVWLLEERPGTLPKGCSKRSALHHT